MKLANIILVILAFAFLSNEAIPQKLLYKRTDVDTAFKNEIVVKYLFGIDFYTEEVDSVVGISFALQFDHKDYVKYSSYSYLDFDENDRIHVVEYNPILDPLSGAVAVSVLARDYEIIDSGKTNPSVIHLEFSLAQDAPSGEEVNFTIVEPKAAVYEDGIRKIIDLNAEDINLTIHGYIDVWPGDANNDGAVDHTDFVQVDHYYQNSDDLMQLSRKFKRKDASTIWRAHRVIAWDLYDATYADCDGDGEITEYDQLVIIKNITKRHTVSLAEKPKQHPEEIQSEVTCHDCIRVPAYIKEDNLLAVAGKINLSSIPEVYSVIGLEKGDAFDHSASHISFKLNQDNISFFCGNYSDEVIDPSQPALYLLLKSESAILDNPDINFNELKAVDKSGFILNIGSMTGVETADDNFLFNLKNNILEITAANRLYDIRITDMFGITLHKDSFFGSTVIPDTQSLSSGVYFAVVSSGDFNKVIKFTIVK